MAKKYLQQNVYDAAVERLNFIYDEFDDVCVSFSGGKDSTVLLHLTLEVARQRNKLPVNVLFIDLEGQYSATIEHIYEMVNLPDVKAYWVCLPLNLRNAVSAFEPHWCCWEPGKNWVREMPKHGSVIDKQSYFPFYRYRMEFEEFTPAFAGWLADGRRVASLVGIRADESLNRYRTIVRTRASRYKDKGWTTNILDGVYNAYPIYDWRVEDVWAYIGKNTLAYNKLYDRMHLAGKSIHEMRICQPYGDDQRKGLDQFHKIEPETWFKIVQRVSGANFGSLYCGNKMLGYNRGLGLPPGHTWKSYTKLLLDTMPTASRLHFRKKFNVFIRWWRKHGDWQGPIPDEADRKQEAAKKIPSWRRMAMCLLKNDFWCKSLSFSMTKDLYQKHYVPIETAKGDILKERYKNI